MDLDRAAERFDAVYTAMTTLQRRLIDAQRNGVDATAERELIDEASSISAAVEVALRSLGPSLSVAEAEAAALAARLLQPPVDGNAVAGALRSMVRRQAFPFLSAALRMSASDMPGSLGGRRVVELLAAPRAMGEQTARALCRHWSIDPDVALEEFGASDIEVLCERIEDAASHLPPEVRGARGQRPAASPDGSGEATVVLDLWVECTGPPLEGVRTHVVAAARRPGWPDDAVPVALLLAEFTTRCVAPALLDEWGELVEIEDSRDRARAMESQAMIWLRSEDEELEMKAVILWGLREVLDSQIGLNRMDGDYSRRYGSRTAMSLARRIAKAAGELLTFLEPDAVEALLAKLNPALA